MQWLVNFAVVWFCLSVLIIATGWYFGSIIRDNWPDWWHRVVMDRDPFEGARKRPR